MKTVRCQRPFNRSRITSRPLIWYIRDIISFRGQCTPNRVRWLEWSHSILRRRAGTFVLPFFLIRTVYGDLGRYVAVLVAFKLVCNEPRVPPCSHCRSRVAPVGQEVIILLSGELGVGKTLTLESGRLWLTSSETYSAH